MNRFKLRENPKILNTIIATFLSSEKYKNMLTSDAYYKSKNSVITERQKMMMLFDEKDNPYVVADYSKANYKIPHNFHFELINQTKSYICGKPVRVSWKDEIKDVDDKPNPLKTEVENILYKHNDWGTYNQENVKNAQLYSEGWSRVVVDNSGNLRFINVDSKEVIPLYDDFGELECLIRVYEKVEYDDNGVSHTLKYAEVYDAMFKDVYLKYDGANFKGLTNPTKYKEYALYTPDVPLLTKNIELENGFVMQSVPLSWGKIPWICWKFNTDEMDSLTPIKPFIDILDIDLSDLANNVDDIQEMIWILENYQGQSIEQFMQDLKIKKAINVGEGGKVEPKSAELPYEARMKLYEAAEKNIYRFGRGIDFAKRDQLGNSTGVALKWSYGPLDEKSSEIEQNGQSALNRLFNLIFTFLGYKGFDTEKVDSNSVEFIFDRTMITNEKETIESIVRSSILLSTKTLLENHPMVDDADEELKRLTDPQFGSMEVNNAQPGTTNSSKQNVDSTKSSEGNSNSTQSN